MKLPIRCMAASCGHRFSRTASEVLDDGTCPMCKSADIDFDADAESRRSPAVDGRTIERSMEKAFQGLDWDEIRASWAEQERAEKEGSIDSAFTAALQEPSQTPAASGTCPSCGKQAYNTGSKVCSACGYTPEDGTTRATEASRTAAAPPAAPSTGPSPAPSEVNNETARCSFCLKTFPYRSADPTEPIPACPNCGSTATTPAGAAGAYTASLPARTAAKVQQITMSILASNPGMSEADARLVANETVRRFPKVVN